MDDQASLIPPAPLYERLKSAGVNLDWYDKALAKRGKKRPDELTPLHVENCCPLSIYFVNKNDQLWTTKYSGEPYQVVREQTEIGKTNCYFCASCKEIYATYADARAHFEPTKEVTV